MNWNLCCSGQFLVSTKVYFIFTVIFVCISVPYIYIFPLGVSYLEHSQLTLCRHCFFRLDSIRPGLPYCTGWQRWCGVGLVVVRPIAPLNMALSHSLKSTPIGTRTTHWTSACTIGPSRAIITNRFVVSPHAQTRGGVTICITQVITTGQ